MKKAKTMRIASLLLVLVLVTTCFVGTTFAKYTSSASGSDTVQVAKWSILVGNDDITTMTEDVTFNLFNTIKDSNGTSDETDVATGKIAPGTSGSFAMTVTNASEVTAKYTITFTQTQTNMPSGKTVPIKFYSDAAMENEITATTGGTYTYVADATLAYGNSNNSASPVVYWKWAFDGDDATDTAIGVEAQDTSEVPTVAVTATITATQVD